MTESSRAVSGRIFMSYRPDETAYAADWLYDRLAEHFGGEQVFKDVDSIHVGDDFVSAIAAAVESCDVLLALISEEWLTISDADGKRRIDNPHDLVRVEIEAALARNMWVIPILVDGAEMPTASELPASLRGLVRRQALEVSTNRLELDFGRLRKMLGTSLSGIVAGGDISQRASRDAAGRDLFHVERGRQNLQVQGPARRGIAIGGSAPARRTGRTSAELADRLASADVVSPCVDLHRDRYAGVAEDAHRVPRRNTQVLTGNKRFTNPVEWAMPSHAIGYTDH